MAQNKHDNGHAPNVKLYLIVFGALMALTIVTVAISKVHLPRPIGIALGLAVATVKAGLVAGIFMHLKGENKLIYRALYVTAVLALGLIVAMIDHSLLSGFMTSRVSVGEQKPGGAVAPGRRDARPGEAMSH